MTALAVLAVIVGICLGGLAFVIAVLVVQGTLTPWWIAAAVLGGAVGTGIGSAGADRLEGRGW